MWWSCVVAQRGQPLESGISLGSFDGTVMGDRAAKKAAKALGKGYIRGGGPGQPRLVESPLMLAGSIDHTPGARPPRSDDELFEHVVSGRDIFEGSPFYGDYSDDVLNEMELLFQRSGMEVVGYLCGLENIEEEPEPRVAGLIGFGGVTAQGEFWANCRRMSRDRTNEWLEERYEAMVSAFTRDGRFPREQAEKLVSEARAMIEQNWEMVMTLAHAKVSETMDVEGREVNFLRDIYGDPEAVGAEA